MSAANLKNVLYVCSIVLPAMIATACGSADLAGDNRKKAKEPAILQPPVPSQGADAKDDAKDGKDESKDSEGKEDTDLLEGKDDAKDGKDDVTPPPPAPNPTIPIDEGETAAVKHVCKDGVRQVYNLEGSGSKVQVEGELCPRAFGKLTVVFVVDFSGSMKTADPRSILSLFSCGRAKAATAILDRLKKDARSGDDVQVSFVSFGNSAKIESAPKPLKQFGANTFNFCGYENENTNYKAAFDKTVEALNTIQGNKVVYFISDGMPTIGGTGQPSETDAEGTHKAAGLTAANALRASVPNMTLNAIYLDTGSGGAAAQTYLGQVTADPNRVKIAKDAAGLADKIVELSIPKIELKAGSLTAELTAPGYPNATLKVLDFKKDPAKPSSWIFKTDVFKLNAKPGQTVDNTLTLKALDDKGATHEEILTIKLKSP